MAFSTVTITPTVDTSAYEAGDVLFLNTVVPLPARSCKLVDGYVVNYSIGQLASDEITFFFFQNNAAELGTINATANISDADFRLNRFLGACKIETATESELLDNQNIHALVHFGQSSDTVAVKSGINLPLISSGASAPYDGNGVFPVFMTAVIVVGTPNFSSADNMDVVLTFEY